MRLLALLLALGLGAASGAALARLPRTHAIAGRLFGRGELVALVGDSGIFAADVEAQQPGGGNETASDRAKIIHGVIARAVLRHQNLPPVDRPKLDQMMEILQGQFGDEAQLHAALAQSGISTNHLRATAADTISGERWIENRIAADTAVTAEEAARYFESHRQEFALPPRLRARHIFFAAPDGASTDVLASKRQAAELTAARLRRGEDFGQLAWAVSEDEATNARGGDLDFFAANRIPPEFFAAVATLPVGGPPSLVRSHLGFHVVQTTASRPAEQLREAMPEISARLREEKRWLAIERLEHDLAQTSRVFP